MSNTEPLKPARCRVGKGRVIETCLGMETALERANGKTLHLQQLFNTITGNWSRERVVLKSHGNKAPGLVLNYCPFCRGSISTESKGAKL